MINKQSLIDRFLRYVKIDTQSDPTVTDKFPAQKSNLIYRTSWLKN